MSEALFPYAAGAGTQPEAAARTATSPTAIVARAWWLSRLLVWAAGVVSVGALGTLTSNVTRFDPTGVSTSLGSVGNLLAAPAIRGDAIWYLRIAHQGYFTAAATRFFPLYPFLVHVGGWVTGSLPAAGILISMTGLFAALLVVHRLTSLELGTGTAALTVELMAFAPLALFLSAVYSEPLFLAFSAGTFYAARRGRWAWAGALGALAALTRVTGVLLVVPVLVLYLYGPRYDAEPKPGRRGLLPRYELKPSLLWAGLIPAGMGLFACYLTLTGYGPLSFLHAQTHFTRHVFEFPVLTVLSGIRDGWHQLSLGFEGFETPTQNFVGLLALVAALAALPAIFRRLPAAYGLYIVVGLLVPLSSPTVGDPLKGLARYETVLFPLYMVAAAWAHRRGMRRPLLLAFGALLVFFTAQFATWHVVGSQLL